MYWPNTPMVSCRMTAMTFSMVTMMPITMAAVAVPAVEPSFFALYPRTMPIGPSMMPQQQKPMIEHTNAHVAILSASGFDAGP